MKRKLAQEALGLEALPNTSDPEPEINHALGLAPERIRQKDPDGSKGLALLREIEAAADHLPRTV